MSDAESTERVEDGVESYQKQLNDHDARLEAMSRWKQVVNDRLDSLEAENEELRAENEQLRARLDELEGTAKAAYSVANQGGSAEKSKTQIASDLTRNVLVMKAKKQAPAQDRPVTISEIREKAKPDHDLAWQTVRDGWNRLMEAWPQFYETSKNKGQVALSIRPDEVTPALAIEVQEDLGRSDVAKPFLGEKQGGSN